MDNSMADRGFHTQWSNAGIDSSMADRGFHTQTKSGASLSIDSSYPASNLHVCSLCCELELWWCNHYNLQTQLTQTSPHNIIYISIDAQSPSECKVKQHSRNFWGLNETACVLSTGDCCVLWVRIWEQIARCALANVRMDGPGQWHYTPLTDYEYGSR